MSASMIRCVRALRVRSMSTSSKEAVRYPELTDESRLGKRSQIEAQWHNKIRDLGTVEEKLIEINMPRYYGWKCHMLHAGDVNYNTLGLHQHLTKTHLVEGLPAIYNSNEAEEAATQLANELKADFEEAFAFEWNRRVQLDERAFPWEVEQQIVPKLMETLNSVLLSHLAKSCPHLRDVVADPQPRLEAAWWVGGIDLEGKKKKYFEKNEFLKECVNWPRDRHIQYLGSPVLQVRAKNPLQPIMSKEESASEQLEVPMHRLDPRVRGIGDTRRYMTNIPGFWPNDTYKFGAISYHTRPINLYQRPTFTEEDKILALHSEAILASFAWLFGQACYQGFSTFNDITYPLVSQTIISNGKSWSFYTYQLNTTVIQFDETKSKSKNICWSSKPMDLFESIDNGKLTGFNMEVLKTLVKFYLNKPKERIDVDMTPYLDKEAPTISQLEHEERREFLDELLKKLALNGKKHLPDPEYWNWEWIYKIRFKTRPNEARRRPFELWQNPWKTKFADLQPKYVPKVLRENPKDRRQKWKKTYYP